MPITSIEIRHAKGHTILKGDFRKFDQRQLKALTSNTGKFELAALGIRELNVDKLQHDCQEFFTAAHRVLFREDKQQDIQQSSEIFHNYLAQISSAKSHEARAYWILMLLHSQFLHDPKTWVHSVQTAAVCETIEKAMHLRTEYIKGTRLSVSLVAYLLHDIGKFGTPGKDLHDPHLSRDKISRIQKTHVPLSIEIVDHISWFPELGREIIRLHHYYKNQEYDEIIPKRVPKRAKLIACGDSYHAMRTRSKRSVAETFRILYDRANNYPISVVKVLERNAVRIEMMLDEMQVHFESPLGFFGKLRSYVNYLVANLIKKVYA